MMSSHPGFLEMYLRFYSLSRAASSLIT